MALTIVVLAGGGEEAGDELTLSLDAPRVIIGRGEGCELRLPDPSVSHRHASIRQRGANYVLLDEGSENGTFLGRTRLSPRSPAPLRSGDRVRVGRVWLAIRVEPIVVKGAPAAAAKELALELVARGLTAQGEDPRPRVVVLEGPDQGRSLFLEQSGRPYVIGRSTESDLALDDADASRRHLVVTRRGDQFSVQDLGSRRGAQLDGAPVPQFDTPWRHGQVLSLCRDRLLCEHPAAEALAELERGPCEPLGTDEVLDPPLSAAPPSSASSPSPPPSVAEPPPPDRSPSPISRVGSGSGWGFADGAVMLVALGVLALSIAGLVWLLGRG